MKGARRRPRSIASGERRGETEPAGIEEGWAEASVDDSQSFVGPSLDVSGEVGGGVV